ncbi:MAG: maleylacetoacetate isomerase [Burkholderiales bacterium]|nr:maleylacetoacetate isomerase [Burkholderiales bacterium]ODU72354.1 MAG: maleylacetoacetate isomerase [Bordetella sp. SCN 68-11]
MKLYTYWRSSTAYRVRIALNLKGLAWEPIAVNLATEQNLAPAFTAVNPQGLVPALLLDDGRLLVQSPAILEYLEERWPEPPLLPADREQRATARALASTVACDIHPLNNARVLRYLKRDLQSTPADCDRWYRHWIAEGLRAFEALLGPDDGSPFCCGSAPTMADICLVPQLYNARRFGCPLDMHARLVRIEQTCLALPAFAQAAPESQPDRF